MKLWTNNSQDKLKPYQHLLGKNIHTDALKLTCLKRKYILTETAMASRYRIWEICVLGTQASVFPIQPWVTFGTSL